MEHADVLITSDATKLPADVAALLDPAVPLPSDVRFFETRFDVAHLMKTLLFAGGFALAAVVVIPIGVAVLFEHDPTHSGKIDFWPLGFGLLFAFVAWIMGASLLDIWRLRARQRRGEITRRGTFLTPTAFIQASENDTTILPPAHFRGLDGGTIRYELKTVPKSFTLPAAFVGTTPAEVRASITDWAAIFTTPPVLPPPSPH